MAYGDDIVNSFRAGREDAEYKRNQVKTKRFSELAGSLATTKDRAPIIQEMSGIDAPNTLKFADYYQGQDQQAAQAQAAQKKQEATQAVYAMDAIRTSKDPKATYMQIMGPHYEALKASGIDPSNEQIVSWINEKMPEAYAMAGIAPPKAEKPTFTAPQAMVINKEPVIAQVGPDGQPRVVPGASPYRAPTQSVYGNADPSSARQTAQMIASGQIPMITGRNLSTPWGQEVVKAIKEINPDFSATTYPTKAAALKDFTSGMTSRKVRSLNTAIDHMGTLDELSQALGNGDIKLVNKLGNEFAKETGNPAPTNFNAARDLVAKEIISAVVAGGGGQAEREEASASINAAGSPEQLKQVIETYRHLLGGQMRSLDTQYQQGTGMQDFERFLTPRTKKALGYGNQTAPQAEVTATGPNGQKIVLRNGAWVQQ